MVGNLINDENIQNHYVSVYDHTEFKNKCTSLQSYHVVYFLTCRGKINHYKYIRIRQNMIQHPFWIKTPTWAIRVKTEDADTNVWHLWLHVSVLLTSTEIFLWQVVSGGYLKHITHKFALTLVLAQAWFQKKFWLHMILTSHCFTHAGLSRDRLYMYIYIIILWQK
jgi:hypothetical protein